MGRLAGFLVKAVLGLVVLVVIGAAGLAIRLAAGPMEVSFLKAQIEAGLSAADGSFTVKSETILVEWRGWDEGLQLTMKRVRLLKADKSAFAALPEVSVKLSAPALLSGTIAPTEVIVRQPQILLRRSANGIVSLGLTPTRARVRTKPVPRRGDSFIPHLLRALRGGGAGTSPLAHLDRIRIEGADVVVEDGYLDHIWRTRKFTAVIQRQDGRVNAGMSFDLLIGEKPIKFKALLNETTTGGFAVRFDFDQLDPALFRSARGPMVALNWLRLPLKGRFSVRLHRNLQIQRAQFALSGAMGTLKVPHFFSRELQIRRFMLRGEVSGDGVDMRVTRLLVDFGGTTLTGSGHARRKAGRVDIKGTASISAFPVSRVREFWPSNAKAKARKWVVENISAGQVTSLDATAALRILTGDKPVVQIRQLKGQFGFRNLSIRYFKPLPLVTGATGVATFDDRSMKFSLDAARLQELVLKSATVDILGFKDPVRNLHVRADVRGPLRTVLKIIDRDPLGYAGRMGISPLAMQGRADFRIDVWVGLHSPITFKDVGISVDARLSNVFWRRGVFGLTLSKSAMRLKVSKREMSVTGTGLLQGRPAKFRWYESLAIAPVRRRLELTGAMDAAELRTLGASPGDYLKGTVGARIKMVSGFYGRTSLDAVFDMRKARMEIPYIGLSKPEGVPARVVARFAFQNERLLAIPSVRLKGQDVDLRGSVLFYPDRSVRRISISRLVTPSTDAALTLDIPRRGPRQLRIKGKRVDVSRVFDMRGRSSNAPLPPMVIRGSVERVYFRPGVPILNLSGGAVFDGADWRSIDLRARAGKGPISVRLIDDSNRRRLVFRAANAGATLRALNVADEILGGVILVRAIVDDAKGHERFRGTAVMRNFRVQNAPAAIRLIALASESGVGKSPPGKGGIVMEEFVAPVSFQRGLIEVRDGRAVGNQLGITLNGAIDLRKDTLEFRGTIVPAYSINSILGKITAAAKGGGLIALSYRVTGTLKKPDVSVNPLSVITPPLLRRLFNTYSRSADDNIKGGDQNKSPINQDSIGR